MAIIYSYPIATPQDADLLIISRTPTDPDEISNYSVNMSSVADYVIDKAFNGTDRYIPRFDGASSLVNSVIYQDTDGHVGVGVVGTPPNPVHKFEVFDLRDENPSSDYSSVVTTHANEPWTGGGGGILSRLSVDSGATYAGQIGFVPGTQSNDIVSNIKLAIHANSDMDTRAPSNVAGTVTHDGTDAHWILNGTLQETTTAVLKVNGRTNITGDVQIDTLNSGFIPYNNPQGILADSVIYQDADGHVGINVQPNPEHVLEVFDDRTGDPSGQHSIYLTTYNAPTPGSGSGGILARVSGDSGATFNSIAMVPGSSSSDWMTSNQTSFYANSNLDTSSATGYSGKITHDGTDAHWILGGVFNDTTNATLEVKGAGIFTGSLRVGVNNTINDGGYNIASGQENDVLGSEAVAFGFNNTVEGNRCGALGANNIVTSGQVWVTGDGNDVGIKQGGVGGNIVVSGFNNTVKSGNSCAIGTGNSLTNTTESSGVSKNFALGSSNTINDTANSITLGFNNTIDNFNSFILGKSNTTSANDTYAVGLNNTLSSNDDYAFGLNNTLSGSANIAMALGHNNILSGSQSYAFGRNLIDGDEDNTVIIGRYNTAPTATGRIVFGTGFSETGRKNAIEIQAGNAAQSGLLFPALRLSVSYNSDADAASAGVQSGELYRSNNQVKINTNQAEQNAKNNEGFAFLTPRVKTITEGENFSYKTNYNILKLEWSGGGTQAGVELPPPERSDVINRVFRIVTGSSMIGKQINVTAANSNTINGQLTQIFSGAYVHNAIWSDGVEYYIV